MSKRLLIILIFTGSLIIILFLNSLLVPKREPNRPSETTISDLVRNEAITTRISGISKQKNISIHNSDDKDEATQLFEKFDLKIPSRDEFENLILSDEKIETMIAAGIILKDPSFFHAALELNPNNPHVFFLLAQENSISLEKKLAFARNLLELQPDNLVASYLLSSIQIELEEYDASIKTLLETDKQNLFNDFFEETATIVKNCLLEFNNSEAGASLYSIFNMPVPMALKYRQISKFLSENQALLEARSIQTRKIIAEIGSNLVNQRGLIINELVGISIQKMAMDNMDDEDPSPFEGMNIIQAKKNLELQKKEIRDSAATDVFQISDLDHETIILWSDLILEKGEFEANRWIKSKLNSQ